MIFTLAEAQNRLEELIELSRQGEPILIRDDDDGARLVRLEAIPISEESEAA